MLRTDFGRRISLGMAAAVAAAALAGPVRPALAQNGQIVPSRDVGIDQKLNNHIPLDARYRDEDGNPVTLGQFFRGKPVVLNLIFYTCKGACNAQLDGMLSLFKDLKLDIGKDFQIVTVSINPKEGSIEATDKKRACLEVLGRPANDTGWRFLTGTEPEIRRLANAVGFRYVYDPRTDQYAHVVSLILVTPQGRISKYFNGAIYRPKDVRLAMVEASNNKIGTVADQVFLLCADYDATTGRYGVSVMKLIRIVSAGTILLLGISISVMLRVDKARKR